MLNAFELRSVLVGLAIGCIVSFTNLYFGLQTGWIDGYILMLLVEPVADCEVGR